MKSHLLRRTTTTAVSSPATHLLLLSSFLLHLTSSSSAAAAAPTAYEELLEYDFPVGLLPQGVTGYELNNVTGEFKAYMKETCSFKIQGYNLKYKSTISGVIEKGKLKNLKGINVKILVVWLNIVEVSRHGDQIDFSVGIMSAGFGVSNFYESPQCGCGFDCKNGIDSNQKTKFSSVDLETNIFLKGCRAKALLIPGNFGAEHGLTKMSSSMHSNSITIPFNNFKFLRTMELGHVQIKELSISKIDTSNSNRLIIDCHFCNVGDIPDSLIGCGYKNVLDLNPRPFDTIHPLPTEKQPNPYKTNTCPHITSTLSKMSSTATTLSFLLLLLSATAATVSAAKKPTVYEVLEEYDFPAGLLPTGVTDYKLNQSTGEFEVKLRETCSFTVKNYDLRYKSTINGVISKDKLRKLKGVSVKLLVFWADIVEVSRDGNALDFSVGIMSAGFKVDGFDESPECGCGFDCNALEIGGHKKKKVDDVYVFQFGFFVWNKIDFDLNKKAQTPAKQPKLSSSPSSPEAEAFKKPRIKMLSYSRRPLCSDILTTEGNHLIWLLKR
ncbi:hypothetical protein OSB04_020210 [Centaurea solstitialis]|uniref:DUF538 family protein n=1 Tax=Centaurea solstitialis TaxID=347529 RepID=A0AA38W5P1_9ASTR|nr:hypothetical protein OSB04_020210 [Centaurea solstitialis]